MKDIKFIPLLLRSLVGKATHAECLQLATEMLADQRRFDHYINLRFKVESFIRLREAKAHPEKMPEYVRQRLVAQLNRLRREKRKGPLASVRTVTERFTLES